MLRKGGDAATQGEVAALRERFALLAKLERADHVLAKKVKDASATVRGLV